MTEFEKRIYNTHLAVSRSLRNKPFKKRENFNNFETDSKFFFIKRLAIFFQKYPDIDMGMYFTAPYKLYNDVEYFDLNYFASPRAIKSYSIFKQELLGKSPDHHKQSVLDSLQQIAKFCLEKRIQLDDYITYKETSIEPEWLYHVKKFNLNFYVFMEFPNVFDIISKLPVDEKELLLGDFGVNYITYKTRYNTSKYLKQALQQAYIKIKFFIDKELLSKKSNKK
jgi:hypothetical protein